MERNGPPSLPDGLMVPKIAAMVSRIGSWLSANTEPDRGWAQPAGVEIEPENNRKKPVGKGTDTAGGKEHPTITRQRSEPH